MLNKPTYLLLLLLLELLELLELELNKTKRFVAAHSKMCF